MSTVTTYLNLVKPASPEQFSLATYNNNLDLLDTHLKDVVQKMAKGRSSIATVITNSGNIGATLTVVYNIASFAFKAGRKYRIVWDTDWIGNSGTVAANFRISLCSTADAAGVTTGLTNLIFRNGQAPIQLVSDSILVTAYYEPVADVTLQIKFLGILESGTTFLVQGNRAGGAIYSIIDEGAQY